MCTQVTQQIHCVIEIFGGIIELCFLKNIFLPRDALCEVVSFIHNRVN